MRTIFCACVVAVVVLNACSSGKSTFERGNYYEAVITSVNRLRKNSDHKKSVETLRQAYPMAVAFYEDRAKTSLASSERFKWSEVVKSYTYINTMYDDIKRCPGALAVIPNPVNYFSKLQEARQNAAEEQYAAGILALQGATRENAKQAYAYFKTTNEFVPGYKEVNEYMKAALDAATVKIVVEQIPVHSKTVGVSADFFNDKISEFVHGTAINEFVKFYTRPEAQKIKLNPDHIIQLQFDDFTVGEVYKHEKEIQLTKDSVVMGTYISPSTTAATPANPANTTTSPRDAFAYQGTTPVVAAPANPASNQNAEKDKAAAELAEKRRLEQQQAEKALADKLKAEKEAAEKEAAEKQRLANEAAAKAEAAKAEAERAAKEAAQKSLAEKAAAEKEAAEKERLANEAAEKERIAKLEAGKAAKEAAEKERIAREAAEKERAAKAEAERAAKEAAEKAAAEKIAAEKAAAEKAAAEKAEGDKGDKGDRGDKGDKGDRGKYVDPTISKEDTLDVKDPVYVCHMPPGNKMNSRTLKINRSALKAHLAHGDSEGSCEGDKPDQKGKPDNDSKGSSGEDKKNKPQDEKKGKGPGGSASIESDYHKFLKAVNQQVLLASSTTDPYSILRYLTADIIPGDTNKVYGTVKATLYHYTKTTTSKGIVSFRILDAKTGALLAVEKMPGEYVWKSEWATFNGDERALSSQQLQLTKQKEAPAPAPQELFIEFTRPIYDQITTKIRDFYKGY